MCFSYLGALQSQESSRCLLSVTNTGHGRVKHLSFMDVSFPSFPFSCVWYVYVHVFMYVGTCVCVSAHVHGYVRTHVQSLFSPYWSRVSQSNPQVTDISSLASQLALRIPCLHLPRLEVQVGHHIYPAFRYLSKFWDSDSSPYLCAISTLTTKSHPQHGFIALR